MYIKEKSLDDLLHKVTSKLLKSRNRIKASRGDATELTGVLLQLTDPRARLSRTEKKGHVFSCLGELLWYLAGTNDLHFISYYVARYEQESDDGQTVYGGYGPRLFNMAGQHNQIENVLNLLKKKPGSRRAVIQLFDAEDIARHYKEIPCTCTLQFMVRNDRLHMITYMRSNDAFLGLPHDIFSFTMLQEIMARAIGVDIGAYKHAVGSLHLYDRRRKDAQQYIDEAFQLRVPMPPMPSGDPWRSIRVVLDAECQIRNGNVVDASALNIGPYWEDLVRLLQIFRFYKNGDTQNIAQLNRRMASDVFAPYIEQKRKTARKRPALPQKGQLSLLLQ
jgi:thymidylate synthase